MHAEFEKNPEAALRKVRELGYDHVELAGDYGWTAEKWLGMLAETGLKVVSAHIGTTDKMLKTLEKELALQPAIGNLKFGICDIAPEHHSLAGYKKTASDLNILAEQVKSVGGIVFYHHHDFDFKNYGGRTGFDILLEETDPSVMVQIDTYWVEVMGLEAVPSLEKYTSRLLSIHAKEIDSAHSGRHMVVGEGSIDFSGVVEFARSKDIPVIVEFEGENPIEPLAKSAVYLKKLISGR